MGQYYIRVLSLMKDVEFVGIVDVNVEWGLDIVSKYWVYFFEDYQEMLFYVDVVCVVVFIRFYYDVGMNCL